MKKAKTQAIIEFRIKFLGKSGKFIVMKCDEKCFHISKLLTELTHRKNDEDDVTDEFENAYAFLMDVYSKKIRMAWGSKSECGGFLQTNKQDLRLGIFDVIEVINK